MILNPFVGYDIEPVLYGVNVIVPSDDIDITVCLIELTYMPVDNWRAVARGETVHFNINAFGSILTADKEKIEFYSSKIIRNADVERQLAKLIAELDRCDREGFIHAG